MSIRNKALQWYEAKYVRVDKPYYTSKYYQMDESPVQEADFAFYTAKQDGYCPMHKDDLKGAIERLVDESDTDTLINKLIDQIYQFSRMNWKSVSQQNLPVTIKYPEIVPEIFPYFNNEKLPDFGKENLWFL
ncbi:MAG: hypothetical protein IPP81_09235 [Chitinophagaceae bacterium]|nr:hypothetical protein [Chitinophagaceae bacterium]